MFINLHVHDAQGSLLDSILTVPQLVNYAAEHGQKAIALTNHGYMSSFVDFVKACKKAGIKPIVGNEIYEVDDMWEKTDTKEYKQPRYHLVLLAKNDKGFHNLVDITSVACTEGLYKKPRIDLKYIKEHNLGSGIICLTACQAGRLSKYLTQGKIKEANSFVDKLTDIFDDVFIELQSHNTEDQTYANRCILKFAEERNLPYVITTDAHMLNESLMDSHAVFVAIGEDRDVGESYSGCFLQDDKKVYEILNENLPDYVIQKGINESVKIAESVQDDIDFGLNHGNQMPEVKIEGNFNSHEEYLRHLVFATFDEKFGDMSEEEQQKRRDRLEMELPVLYELGYTDYCIMLYMLFQKIRERKIPIGYGRGSAAGSLCLYMLNVTQIDSVRWGLQFSRFANLGRKGTLADVDIDLAKSRRKEIVEISEELFGKDNVAPIATFNTLSTKVAIADIGKVLNENPNSPYYKQIPYSLRDKVRKQIPTIKTLNDLGEEENKDVLLKELLNSNHFLQDVNDKFPLWFKHVTVLEGLPKSMGRHAAGTLITPKPVHWYAPLCLDKHKDTMCQLEMHSAMDTGNNGLGLVKMDFLGLETLDTIDETLNNAHLTWEDVDINHLDLADEKVFKNIYASGNTIGVFQCESAECINMLKDVKANDINDIIAVNAANRPATKEFFPQYIKNKLYPEKMEFIHPDLKEIFAESHGVMLYQEQALKILRYAGFPENEVETGRRAIAKKHIDEMKLLEPKFRNGLKDKGWTDNQIDELWEIMIKQSSYSFNLSHSVCYALLSYLTAYLKVHFPVEFMAALLTSKSDKVERLSTIINDCSRMGIKVLPPNVNKSNKTFTPIPKKNQILFGLLGVKGLGNSIIDKMLEQRPYKGFKDFVERLGDKTAIITMIKAGGLPVSNKNKALRIYADMLYQKKDYKPVKSLPTYKKLLLDYNLDKEDYLVDDGKKIDKDRMLKDYNALKKKDFDEKQNEKYVKNIKSFANKYAQDQFLWEFETLSMFLTKDPLAGAYKYIEYHWDDVAENTEATILCVIVDIKRKKDKNGNQFAYIDLYTPDGIIEGTAWSSQLKEYSDLIYKGSCNAMFGRKNENHFFLKEMKPYKEWIKEMKHREVK